MKKDVQYYLNLPYRPIIMKGEEEGVYATYFPELPGGATTARPLEEVRENAADAKRVWLEAVLEDGYPIREPEQDLALQQNAIAWSQTPREQA